MRWAMALLPLLVALGGSEALSQQQQPPASLRPIVLFNQHLYGGDLAEPRGIAFDPLKAEVWVADTRNNVLGAFTPEGVPIYTTPASDRVREPAKVAVDSKGRLYVLDNERSHIKMLNYRGEFVQTLDLPGLPEVPSFGTLAVDAEDNLYVGENETGEVLVFGPDLKPRLRFGTRGDEEGQFQSIGGIAADKELIFVVDHQVTPAVQVFDRRGNYVRGWGAHQMGIQNFSLPEAIAIDSKGRVIILDALRHEIKFFSREGLFLDRFGGWGARPGQVSFPVDLAIDSKDHLYIVEKGNSRVQVLEEVEQTKPARR